jgi:predicted HD phosphohydrolase
MTMPGLASVAECLDTLAHARWVADELELDVLAHSLQCGDILRRERPDDLQLAVAGLVHDIADAVTPGDHTDHDRRGAELVRGLLGPRVARLVGAHVIAKRYLVTTELMYRDRLSVRSVETLAAQGGMLGDDELGQLSTDPDFEAILALRRADERAKDPSARVPELESWRDDLELVARVVRAGR